jgi:hypothetical protein
VSIDFALAQPVLGAGPQERVQATLQAGSAVLADPTLQGAATDQERKQRIRQIILRPSIFAKWRGNR